MKRLTAAFLTILLALSLTACGAKKPMPIPDMELSSGEQAAPTGQGAVLDAHFAIERHTWTEDYVGSDGVLLATARFDLPQLTVRSALGNELMHAAPYNTAEWDAVFAVRDAFNPEMSAQMTMLITEYEQMCVCAAEDYAFRQTEGFPWVGNYADEMTFEVALQNDSILSIIGSGYTYTGGAHPNSYTRTWNFDLTTGEFLTIDDFGGATFYSKVVGEIQSQIYAQRLWENYFDDYESYINDLFHASVYLSEQGLHVVFDSDIIAPHAVGAQSFVVPYEVFCNYLSEGMAEKLPLTKEQGVLADYYDTLELWDYFHLTSLPTDYEAPSVEIPWNDGSTMPASRVNYHGVTTLADLHALLEQHISPELAAKWIDEHGATLQEVGGVLYCVDTGRGSDISYGASTRTVEFSGDGGKVIEVFDYYDWDSQPESGEWVVTDHVTVEYPFTLRDGHAVFSAFDIPY